MVQAELIDERGVGEGVALRDLVERAAEVPSHLGHNLGNHPELSIGQDCYSLAGNVFTVGPSGRHRWLAYKERVS